MTCCSGVKSPAKKKKKTSKKKKEPIVLKAELDGSIRLV